MRCDAITKMESVAPSRAQLDSSTAPTNAWQCRHSLKVTSSVARPRPAKNWHNLNELLTIKKHCSSWLEKRPLRSLFVRISCRFYIFIDDSHKHARSRERDGHLHLDEGKLTATQVIMHNAALQLWKPDNNYIQKKLYF